MKKVIRKSVFETNSSSTHSFTIEKNKSRSEHQLDIVSAEEKLVWLLSMIENAEEVWNYPCAVEFRQELIDTDIDKAKEKLASGEITLESLGYETNEQYFEHIAKSYDAKTQVLELKEKMFSYYCKVNNFTREEAENIVINRNEVPPENNTVRFNSECKGKLGEPFSCARYFDEGALMDCECGFENYGAINYEFYKLNQKFKTEEKMIEWFLSDKCKIVAHESWW